MADEIAYRDLKPGEVIQAGDEWQTESGQWTLFHQSMIGLTTGVRARRPFYVTILMKDRDWLAMKVSELLQQNQHLAAELARLQQSPPAASHIVDGDKMVETELEQMAWELYSRLDVDEEGAFVQAEHFIAERNRRRKIQRENDAITTDVVGD